VAMSTCDALRAREVHEEPDDAATPSASRCMSMASPSTNCMQSWRCPATSPLDVRDHHVVYRLGQASQELVAERSHVLSPTLQFRGRYRGGRTHATRAGTSSVPARRPPS